MIPVVFHIQYCSLHLEKNYRCHILGLTGLSVGRYSIESRTYARYVFPEMIGDIQAQLASLAVVCWNIGIVSGKMLPGAYITEKSHIKTRVNWQFLTWLYGWRFVPVTNQEWFLLANLVN